MVILTACPAKRHVFILPNLSTIRVTEFYREFCEMLGLEPLGNKTGMFHAIQEQVYYLDQEEELGVYMGGEAVVKEL